MTRLIWRKDSGAWEAAKGLWGTLDNVTWSVCKKAWVNNGGTWTQVWPPDQTFTSFVVTETSGEVAYTTSNVSWSLDTSVPGTVSIQQKPPGGSYSDVATGLAVSGSTSITLGIAQGAAGTWTYRVAFIPTEDPTYISYSSEDTASLTVSTISYTLTPTTGEVYYTSGSMNWTTTGSIPGSVTLQRKLTAGGTWTTFQTGLARTGSGSYQLAPAGSGNTGTWYYRAIFIPTVDATWLIYSSEDSAVLSFSSKFNLTTASTELTVFAQGELDDYVTVNYINYSGGSNCYVEAAINKFSGGFPDYHKVVSADLSWSYVDYYYITGYPAATTADGTGSGGSVTGMVLNNVNFTDHRYFDISTSPLVKWNTKIINPWYYIGRGAFPSSLTAGFGYTQASAFTCTFHYEDGDSQSWTPDYQFSKFG